MADARVRIHVDPDYKDDDLRRAKRDIDQLDSSATKGGGSFAKYATAVAGVTAAFGAVVVAGRATWEVFQEGAALELARNRFDALAGSIGTTSDAMLTDLKTATGGMVSDSELIASASEMMSLGLVKTHDEVVRLSSVAGQLGWDMNQLTLTLANQSTMRLDALGLSVEGVTGRFQELRGTMTDEEAFKLAVIEAGEAKLELLGSAAETSAGDVAKLQASWQNLTDRMKEDVAGVLAPVVGYLADLATEDTWIWMENQQTQLALTNDTFDEYIEALRDAGLAMGDLESIRRRYNQIREDRLLADLARIYRTQYNPELDKTQEKLEAMARIKRMELNPAIRESTSYFEDEYYAMLPIPEKLGEIADTAADETAPAIRDLSGVFNDQFGAALRYAEDEAFDVNRELFDMALKAGATDDELRFLALTTGEWTTAQIDAALKAAALKVKMEELIQRWKDGELSIFQVRQELAKFQDEWNNLHDKTITLTIQQVIEQGGLTEGQQPEDIDTGIGSRLRHYGGPVTQSVPYIVGERGPEIFVPRTDGTIVPSPSVSMPEASMTGIPSGGTTINNYIHNRNLANIVNRQLLDLARPATVVG